MTAKSPQQPNRKRPLHPLKVLMEGLEERIALTINYAIAPGTTLDIFPLSSIIPAAPAGMDRMEVLLPTIPGVAHGTVYRVSGLSAYPWGSGAPNVFTTGAGNNRIFGGEGFRYVNNGTGSGTSESIPVKFRDGTGFNTLNETIVIKIDANLKPPTIATQPNPFIQIPPGAKATMSVLGSGDPLLTYQWYTGNAPDTSSPIPGATSTSYTTPVLSVVQQYHYWVRVTNSGGHADSNGVTVQVALPSTVTTANVSTPYKTTVHAINLSATVTPATNVGNVTFTSLALGGATATSATIVNGLTGNTAFTVPAGAAAGAYGLEAHYQAPAGIAESFDNKTLTITKADTTIAAANRIAVASGIAQSLSLSATVSSAAGTVTEGTVTFTLLDGATTIGAPVTSATVAGGTAGVSYSLPANTRAGTYTIKAVYNQGPNYNASSDTVHTLTEAPAITPSVTKIPATATSIVINGFGFDTTLANNVFTFPAGISGAVTAATANSLTITSLSGLVAGTFSVSVSVKNAPSTTVQVATVTPVVTASTIAIRGNTTTLAIKGFGFANANANNSVTFTPAAPGSVTASSPTQLTYTFSAPLVAGNLSATVTSNGVTSGVPVQVATVDTTAPTASGGQLNLDAPLFGTLSITFSETIANALLLSHLSVDALGVPALKYLPVSVVQDPNTHVATYSFPTGFANRNYHATLTAAGLTDLAGNPMAANYGFDFWWLSGDANRDRSVGFADLVAVAQNYDTDNTYANGDVNGDGKVSFADLVLVAQSYDAKVPLPAPPVPAALAPAMSALPDATPLDRAQSKSLFSVVPVSKPVNATTKPPARKPRG